jgi:predicted amidohydrolase
VPSGLHPDGPELARLIALAGDLVICAGYSELAPEGLYASAVCVSGDGVLGHQRKVHLPPAERFAYTAGDGFAAFDTPAGRLGMLLCYDKLFPEAARALALDGAELLCSLSAWPVDRLNPARRVRDDKQTRHFDLCDAARAVENQVFVVSANQTGRWGPLRFLGSAKVVDPDGAVLARTGAREGLAVAEVDLAAVGESRMVIDHLADRRPEAYLPAASADAAFGIGL